MKKILPLLMVCSLGLILPSVVLTNKTNSTSAETATVITHLVLTENGLYNGEAGQNNSELYLENTVAYEAAVGSELPGSDVITNKVSGVTFAGWVTYEGEGVPQGVTKVSNINNSIVYASWNHDGSNLPSGGGNQGGGDVSGEVMRVYFKAPNNWTNANIYYWTSNAAGPVAWPGTAMNKDNSSGLWYYDYDTIRYDNVIFNNGSEQTEDLKSPTNENLDCYVYNNGWYNDDTNEDPKELESGLLYLKPNSNWKVDGARFAAYFFGSGEVWVSMIDSNNDGIYEVESPAGFTKVIFCRMNPSSSANDWNNKWNQTGDLSIPTDGRNMYTISEGSWDSGTWSTYVG